MSETKNDILKRGDLTFEEFQKEVLTDYKLVNESREASLLGRKEVLTGKAKFGIFGDGKEVPQVAMAKAFKNGDFRSGYYRDQTFMMAIGELTIKQFFAQLYADPDLEREPASVGRQMNGHFATRSLDENGKWKNLTEMKNSSADVSPTASQMPRLVGLGWASKIYRENPGLKDKSKFSINGNEVAFGTIGNASCAEGMFWESVNAAGVLGAPVAISIWDDGYGISVPNKYQVTKQDLSELLKGFAYDESQGQGFHLYSAKGWDYPELVNMYQEGIEKVRDHHIPAIFHIIEVTQPQGHSTSGSHERYKSQERLQWEQEFDCIVQMRKWIIANAIATEEELLEIEKQAKNTVKTAKNEAYKEYITPIKEEIKEVSAIIADVAGESGEGEAVTRIGKTLKSSLDVYRKTIMKAAHDVLRITRNEDTPSRQKLHHWYKNSMEENRLRYNTHLHSESDEAAVKVKEVKPEYEGEEKVVDGREILVAFFDQMFENRPEVLAFGEDLGKIGGVNQGMAGLQEKYGEIRISDTGIREMTIIGQGIGAAMRGLRPIAEIQYLDYILYALQILSDDVATIQYRTRGGQKAPLIVRTRGHRFEGIWHAGSPMSGIINLCRGIHVCVPRNMTEAAGMYNTLLQSDEPGIIIERLNAYRTKEKLPSNISEITVPLGIPEVLHEGEDVTVVSYGAALGIAEEAVQKLEETGISVELIDVRTLLPFDREHKIVESLKKTNRIVFVDEDVPGGTTAFMMNEVLEKQGGYFYLDSEPRTVTAKAHRPPYASDGDYFSKSNAEDIFNAVYDLMHESDPSKFPAFI